MRLTIGSKVIYPSQGPCRIGAIVQKTVAGRPVNFYLLALLDESGAELFVPVERAGASGIRQLLSKSEIPRLLNQLQQPALAARDWKQRAQENAQRLASGSPFALAEIVESLTHLSANKELSFREGQMLDKARRLLVSELAEVLRKPRSVAEELINQALNRQAFNQRGLTSA